VFIRIRVFIDVVLFMHDVVVGVAGVGDGVVTVVAGCIVDDVECESGDDGVAMCAFVGAACGVVVCVVDVLISICCVVDDVVSGCVVPLLSCDTHTTGYYCDILVCIFVMLCWCMYVIIIIL